jgi:hypothetical protein
MDSESYICPCCNLRFLSKDKYITHIQKSKFCNNSIDIIEFNKQNLNETVSSCYNKSYSIDSITFFDSETIIKLKQTIQCYKKKCTILKKMSKEIFKEKTNIEKLLNKYIQIYGEKVYTNINEAVKLENDEITSEDYTDDESE